METENIKDIIEMLTVSGGDNIAVDDTATENSVMDTVSGNDIESVPANVYVINMLREQSETKIAEQTEEPVYTLFDKPLEEYSVSEGLLLILVLIAILLTIYKIINWGFSWFGW